MGKILVTGGTGTLGREIVARLRGSGERVDVLSRSRRPDVLTGNLLTGQGVEAAVTGAGTVVHCATGRGDVRAARTLIAAARATGSPHLVYISIVGVDRIPFVYYRGKLAVEQLVEESGLPFTILRATQFHNLVAGLFDVQRRLPLLLAPGFRIQPVEVGEVADRMAALATGPSAGRVPDLGGPEVRTGRELARAWLQDRGAHRPVREVTLPGRTFKALRAGHQLAPGHAEGRVGFEEFLRARR